MRWYIGYVCAVSNQAGVRTGLAREEGRTCTGSPRSSAHALARWEGVVSGGGRHAAGCGRPPWGVEVWLPFTHGGSNRQPDTGMLG